ncbi:MULTISPECIES: hypothetical protein [Maricaulis]|uniref:Uncharacterized protein n=1 Tax=Maricaulis maris TaxID=74318 RepID=A0A495DM08_9PROT|nr:MULTISPECIES: hypothetical protein [Maricaulis]RKR03963.1 hypothetical protein C7435_0406 [Maricaulis maris]
MIIQATSGRAEFPRRGERALWLAGLLVYIIGQVLLRQGQDFVEAQRPIDFAHWALLVGGVMLLPFAGRLPWRNIHWLTIPLLYAGITALIGMCVLDFVFWALPNGEMENTVARQLIATPAVWSPFITFGPNYVFVTAVVLPCLSYLSVSRIGAAVVVTGSLVMLFGTQWYNVAGWVMILIGYALCFDGLRSRRLPG